MRLRARSWLLVVVVGALVSLAVAAAAQAETPVIEKLAAVNCSAGHEECAHEVVSINLGAPFGEQHYSVTKEPKEAEAIAEGFVKAGGHVPFGVTDFKLGTTGSLPTEKPTQVVKHIRTDVAPGLATNPLAIPYCSTSEFGKEELPETGLFAPPTCEGATEVGIQQATVYVEKIGIDLALEGKVYNLVPPEKPTARSSLYGVALKLPIPLTKGELEEAFAAKGHPLGKPTEEALEAKQYYAHSLIEGNVEWGQETKGTNQGDYHDYFEIETGTSLPLISSRLEFFGTHGGDFITNATKCPGHNTTTLKVTDLENTQVEKPFTTPIGLKECENVPFTPGFSLAQSSAGIDQPDALVTEFTLPHKTGAGEIDDSQVETATLTLPPGLTLNSAAGAGLEACTPAQARIHSSTFGTECPAGSEVASVALNVPGLPNGSLTGAAYLGAPESGPITGPPYTLYVVANSKRYGVSVRLKGEVTPNEQSGQLTATFKENPEQPFSSLEMKFKGGALATTANGLTCEAGHASVLFSPYSGQATALSQSPFEIGGCPGTIPFAVSQSSSIEPPQGGGSSTFTLGLERPQADQYVSAIRDVLPPGLVGLIPTVTQCGEPQANQGTCTSASQIGTVTVSAGSGNPYPFNGKVYLTGPFEGAPFGLSIVVTPKVGPFELKPVIARARIEVKPDTAQVIATDAHVPLMSGTSGIPVRMRGLTVSINRQGFERNPTNCAVLNGEGTITGSLGGTSTAPLPVQAQACGTLAFKPSFSAASGANFSRPNGASLETTLNMPAGGANVKSVKVTLPKALPSRLTTLQKSCPEATFNANPLSCPSTSKVGTVRANTPTLPAKMTGPAILVSHGGRAFPDLDLILEGNGVRVIVVGNTDIKNSITTTTFATTPDVPVSSITVNLPIGPHSALAAFGDLCRSPLFMPTEMTGQNGKLFKQNTRVNVKGCGVKVVGRKVIGGTAFLTVKTFGKGRVIGSGSGVSSRSRTFNSAQNGASLVLSRNRGGSFTTTIRVRFQSKQHGVPSSSTSVRVRFG
jgi:hypothetical protein